MISEQHEDKVKKDQEIAKAVEARLNIPWALRHIERDQKGYAEFCKQQKSTEARQ